MATNDNADVTVNENRDFYPEDAQERNFDMARNLAAENTKKDQAIAEEDAKRREALEASETDTAAQPETTADTNPEQVNVTEPGDNTTNTQ